MNKSHGIIRWYILLCVIFTWHGLGITESGEWPNSTSPLGINLSRVCYWSTEFAFKDLFKQSQPWQSQAKGKPYGQGPPLALSPHGWVQWLRPGQTADTLITRTAMGYDPGQYICLYNGMGNLVFGKDAKETRNTTGEVLLNIRPSSKGITLTLEKTNDIDPIHNIRLIPRAFKESADKAPFHPRFLKNWSDFKVIRFMDWMGTNNSPVEHWSQRTLPTMQTQGGKGGVALEYMVALANTLHADPWFCMPHRANDAYIEHFAALVKQTLDPTLKIYIEYTNEAWNDQFSQAKYCMEKGLSLGLSDDPVKARLYYYTQRALEIFQIWESIFKDNNRLVRVLSSQFANPWTSTQILKYLNAGHRVDALGVAPYFGKDLGVPPQAQRTLQMTLEQLFKSCEKDIEKNHDRVATHARLASEYNLELVAYEGGQHLVGTQGAENNEVLTFLFHTMNRDPRMKELYLKDLQGWHRAGGGVFVTFASMGTYNKWGSWGLLEQSFQYLKTAPKYQALQTYIKQSQNPLTMPPGTLTIIHTTIIAHGDFRELSRRH